MTNEIILIIECCKTSPDFGLIEEKVSQVQNWDEFIPLVYSHGVFPLVYKIIKNYDDKIPFEKLSFMKQTYMDLVKENMLMTSELIKVAKLLEENGIKSIAFKGPTLSQLAYGDIISRQYVDLDVLIEEKDLLTTAKILEKESYVPIKPIELLENKKYIESDNDYSFMTSNDVHIELHWKLFREKIAKHMDMKSYYSNKSKVKINNENINTLSLEIMIVYLCLHGSKHLWERIEWILDIDKLISSQNKEIDWNIVLDIAEEMNCKISLFLGLNLSKLFFDTKFNEKISELLINKLTIKLTDEILVFTNKLFLLEEDYKKYQDVNLFQLKLIQSKKDKMKHFISVYFSITKNDYLAFPLPNYLNFVYYFIKPFRVFYKVVFKKK